MARDWEAWLATASRPASPTEEEERDRTEKRIREAIRSSGKISASVRVYAKGSYANGTNVRRNADVDIAWNTTRRTKSEDGARRREPRRSNSVIPRLISESPRPSSGGKSRAR